jgi:hypothetical protein
MFEENLSTGRITSGVYKVETVEQFDEIVAAAKSADRLVTVKDGTSVEIHDAALGQLTTQAPHLLSAGDEKLAQLRQDLLSKARYAEPANQSAAQLLQGESADSVLATPDQAVSISEQSVGSAREAFEAAAATFTQNVVDEYSRLKNTELLSAIINTAEQIDLESKKVQLQDPTNKDYFAFRDRHPVGRNYDTHKREYIDSLKQGIQKFISVQHRFPGNAEAISIAGNALLAGYESFIKNEVFNSKISKLSPEEQEQFHDLKASLGGDADLALQEGANRLAVSRRFSSLLAQDLRITGNDPVFISRAIGKSGQKQITKELENSTKDPVIVGALNAETGLPSQFVSDASRSIYKFIESGATHTPDRARDAVVDGLHAFAHGDTKAAFALATVANQATLGSLYKAYVSGTLSEYKLIPAAAAKETDPVGYTLERLPNGNVRLQAYQLQGLRSLGIIPSNPRSTQVGISLLAERDPGVTQIDENNYGVRGLVDIELDGKALEKGKVQILRHAPYTLDIRLKVDWVSTCEMFTE